MTTNVKSAQGTGRELSLAAGPAGPEQQVHLRIGHGPNGYLADIHVPRTDLLAAIETELDVTIGGEKTVNVLNVTNVLSRDAGAVQTTPVHRTPRYWRNHKGHIHEMGELEAADPTIEEVPVVPIDAIVIERADLPEVEPVGARGRLAVEGGALILFEGDTTESAREIALRWLAGSEYLREHPPVDEAEITRIVAALAKTGGPGRVSLDAMARDLHAQGVRVTEAAR
ncbi:hypothetical protein [Cellulomonas rhizosphaerae]|uniref:Uncharacterized protein n=1 Tax=Cellulomonas rhizosphaerae TaxID=2293719 RepID=A0A413RJF4_9CELL|nr:hypothetical protein [Cellulomonas rhizosphaerae]RHA38721.1 hypothetical protein D1825_13385 [Cellulomonas rhizosphaerae]